MGGRGDVIKFKCHEDDECDGGEDGNGEEDGRNMWEEDGEMDDGVCDGDCGMCGDDGMRGG